MEHECDGFTGVWAVLWEMIPRIPFAGFVGYHSVLAGVQLVCI